VEPQEELLRELLVFATVDWVELWLFASLVQESLEIDDPEAVKARSLDLIKELLETGLMEAGTIDWDEGHFESWGLTPEESFIRIEQEWSELGRSPSMADICWFDLTPKGQALVKRWEKDGE
jgi:hypothetical protein